MADELEHNIGGGRGGKRRVKPGKRKTAAKRRRGAGTGERFQTVGGRKRAGLSSGPKFKKAPK